MLPEVTVAEMRILLSLLYTGTTRVHQRQLSALVTLTHLLKLISIPVAIVDEPQTKKKSNKSRNKDALRHERATITFIPEKSNGRGRPAKMLTTSTPRDEKSRLESFPSDFLASGTSNKDKLSLSAVSLPAELTSRLETSFNSKLAEMLPTPASSQPELGSKRTVDYTVAVPLSEAESDMEELVEEMHVFVSDEGRVERLELLQDRDPLREQGEEKPGPDPDTARLRDKVVAGKQGTVTLVQTEEAEGLDHLPNLISVAEAFERSQQPDFNDIASPVVDGTDTEKVLVRNCVICSKALLGRNALGRHMKNVHPAVFGPYRCPHPGCAKMIQSGAKMVTHMYHHTGGRARPHPELDTRPPDQEAASSLATPEKNQNVPAEAAAAESGSKKLTFECNAGVEDCKDSFTTARGFIKHMKDVHNMKPWYCEPCDKRFMERQNLQFHMMSHGNKKNFACDICNKSFANPRQLYTHRALHLGKRYLCQECGYRARSSANLRGHVKTKHEAKQHICKMCSKKFSSGNNLKNHMRIHTGESPYECELCGVKFKRVHHLHSHIESKMHIEVMDKCRRKGHQVPQHLDPLRRVRGRGEKINFVKFRLVSRQSEFVFLFQRVWRTGP